MATDIKSDNEHVLSDTLELSDEPAVQNDDVEEATDIETEDYYPVEYSISSYGADYPVDGLVKRIDAGRIFIPKFQRSYVWNIYRASRFIESLLLGLPVPAIFLSREEESQKLLVIDGQQRLRTLQYFYNGVFEPLDTTFKLRQVQARYQGVTYKTLREEDRLRLDDSILHAIIVKQEKPAGEDPTSIYHIFERLNTGGVLLQPQEIRTCVFHGAFTEFLKELNNVDHWRNIFGKVSTRMRDQELILRFFALLYESDSYKKPMKEFLNRFLLDHRELQGIHADELKQRFVQTVEVIERVLGKKAFKPKRAVNAAISDSIMVGIARRLASGPIGDEARIKEGYDRLLANPHFIASISSSTTDDVNVENRLKLATEAFADTP